MFTGNKPKKAAKRATAPRVMVGGFTSASVTGATVPAATPASRLATLIAETNATMATLSDEGRANVRRHMATKGYRETTVSEFLGLTPEDVAAIEARLAAENAAS